MAEPDKGMAELRAKAAVTTMGRNGAVPVEIDPLAQVLRDKRAMAASKLIDQSIAESDTAAIKADNERLKAQIESQQLREATTHRGADAEWREYMLTEVTALRERLEEQRVKESELQQTLLNEKLALLSGELERLRDNKVAPTDPFAMVNTAIEQAEAIMTRVKPQGDGRPTGPQFDPALEKWKITAELEREKRQMERAEKTEDRRIEYELKRWESEERLKVERERTALQDRVLTDALPRIIDIAQRFLTSFTQQPTGAVAGPDVAPASVPSAAQSQPQAESSAPLPPNVQQMSCQNCGARILYREAFGGVICSRCGAEYHNEKVAQSEVLMDDEAVTAQAARQDSTLVSGVESSAVELDSRAG